MRTGAHKHRTGWELKTSALAELLAGRSKRAETSRGAAALAAQLSTETQMRSPNTPHPPKELQLCVPLLNCVRVGIVCVCTNAWNVHVRAENELDDKTFTQNACTHPYLQSIAHALLVVYDYYTMYTWFSVLYAYPVGTTHAHVRTCVPKTSAIAVRASPVETYF